MEKVVKCLLLKNNQVIVTEIVEVGSELGEPDCKLINPVIMNQSSGDLSTWLDFTDQNELMIHSDSIFTIVDPNKEVLIKYLELTA
jgi:hypothetical protein